ncbi:hypothetical protein K2173_018862 [Erythroxylum novogranatense]|uniref:Uncharacterized protein n=1 Tax=Erythroxylum novogranatense TaxID=1862640 RepID=A0AAV8SBF7_9ROSI|nr:hypothetical protein K2173_018862 [Erythroxylum novogranatense]
MKKSGAFAASVAAASVTAISVSSSSSSSNNTSFMANSTLQLSREDSNIDHKTSSSADKFAPKFDGLRFIETLITAHR